MFKSEQEARETLSKTMVELNELLKSMPMGKAEEPQEAEGQEGADAGGGAPDALAAPGAGEPGAEGGHAEPDGDEGGAPGADQGAPGGDAGAAPGADAGGDPNAQGGDMEGAMRQQAGELDDQELEMMCRILQEEQAKRHEAGQQAQGGDLQMSMKKELASMAKSFKDEISKLTKSFRDEITTVKAENAKLRQRPTAAPAATGSKTAPKVLDKKAAEAKPMTKSYATDYLMGKMRSKDRGGVTSQHVALVNACRSEDDLAQAVEMLKAEQIEIPAPK